jgi:hypothetical protein
MKRRKAVGDLRDRENDNDQGQEALRRVADALGFEAVLEEIAKPTPERLTPKLTPKVGEDFFRLLRETAFDVNETWPNWKIGGAIVKKKEPTPERLTPETARERADNFLGTICERSQIAGCIGKLLLAVQAEAEARKDEEFERERERLKQAHLAEVESSECVYHQELLAVRAHRDRLKAELGRLAAELKQAQLRIAQFQNAVPGTFGEVSGKCPGIEILCQPHEWDNRTTAENAVWALVTAVSMARELEQAKADKESIRQSAIEAGCVEIEVCAGCGKPQPCPSDCPCGSGKRLINARAEAAEKRLADGIVLLRKHGFAANSETLDDALRQILQAYIMEKGNCETLKTRLAELPGRIADALCNHIAPLYFTNNWPFGPAITWFALGWGTSKEASEWAIRALVAQAAVEPSQPALAQTEGEPIK